MYADETAALRFSKGPMPLPDRTDSPVALRPDELMHSLGRHPLSEDATTDRSLCAVSPICIIDWFSVLFMLFGGSTLQKFHACLIALRELGTIKRLFKQNKIIAQLDRCEAELGATMEVFTVSC